MILTLESRIQRLNEMVGDGLIIRNDWVGADEQGRETACLLAALSPEAANAETASACPAEVMPGWFAHFTPWMDDHSSTAEWPKMIRRYAACANQWHTLDEASWRRVEISARRAVVEEAMRHTSDERSLDACRQVLVWLDADMPESSHAAVKATEAAKVAAMEARAAALAAAEAAAKEEKEAWRAWMSASATEAWRAWAAKAQEVAIPAAQAERARSAESAAEAAMAAVKEAPWAPALAADAAESAVDGAEYEASDRIIDAVLSSLEKECGL